MKDRAKNGLLDWLYWLTLVTVIVVGLISVSSDFRRMRERQALGIEPPLEAPDIEALLPISVMGPEISFDWNNPNTEVELAPALREISGLSASGKAGLLWAVNDEEGVLFLVNLKTGATENTIRFGPRGDYEGVEMVGNDVYVLRSDGTLFEVAAPFSQKPATTTIDSPLSAKNDAEGLSYDAKNQQLLIALKGKPPQKSTFRGGRSVVAFSLKERVWLDKPALHIEAKELLRYTASSPISDGGDIAKDFAPSAIAVHPETGDYFILSSTAKVVLCISAGGTIRELFPLEKKRHSQPEGIAFDDAGRAYISNEGRSGRGYILSFDASS